ncbi:proline-rich extensin-like protein EPR1 [Vicia villosa]|uniref:proline-rich extensin-like protein EPR1 n=1 Tax=Vicia villosa TaxID=3911 RepID=UPI00273CDB7B|nr:proline-rich extensin-like protein EPR1 [Vicia villosa]
MCGYKKREISQKKGRGKNPKRNILCHENRRKRMKPWPIRSLTEQPHTDLRATTGSSAFGEPTTPREALHSDHPPPIAATPDPASPPSPPPPQPKPHTTGTALFSPPIASHRGGSKQWENRRKRMKPWPIRSLTEQPHTDLRATTGSSAFGEPTTPREALHSDHPPPIAATPDPASPPSPPPPQPKPHTTGTALFSPPIASHRGGSKQWVKKKRDLDYGPFHVPKPIKLVTSNL